MVAITAILAQASREVASEGGSGELILYTTVKDAHYDLAIGKFNELYPIIKVYSTYGGAGEMKTRIQSEAANPQADAMFGGLQYADLDAYGDFFESYISVNDAKSRRMTNTSESSTS